MRSIPYLIGALFFIFLTLALKPVPITTEDKCQVVNGAVEKIIPSGEKDLTLFLEGHPQRFYLNRALEKGLELEAIREKLVGQKVVLKYPRYWTPLDPSSQTRHVAKLEWGQKVLFDETLPAQQ